MAKRKAERGTIVRSAAIDWLTLTTYDEAQHARLWDTWQANHARTDHKAISFGGYAGIEIAGISFVEGRQREGWHGMVTAGGAEADALAELWAGMMTEADKERWRCTRLDVQYTGPPVAGRPRLAALAFEYEAGALGQFRGRGRPQVSCHFGEDGDTLYIGAPSSDNRLRVYDKPLLHRGRRVVWERTERQMRNDKAHNAFCRAAGKGTLDRAYLAGILRSYIDRMPEGMAALISASEGLNGTVGAEVERTRPDILDDSALRWVRSIRRALTRAATGDDPARVAARALLALALIDAMAPERLGAHEWTLVSRVTGEILDIPEPTII